MRCVADLHYHVVRSRGQGVGLAGWEGAIVGLVCRFCTFQVTRSQVGKPRSSRSGLGRYNRMRGRMVRHLHAEHREELSTIQERRQ